MCFAPQQHALFWHLNFQKWSEVGVLCTFWLGDGLRATTSVHFFDSATSKSVRAWCVLYILTWKCASRHTGVHFSESWTSKSGPTLACFETFWLENVLRAKTACTFLTSQLPTVLRRWRVLYTFGLGNLFRATTACTFSTAQLPKVSENGVFCTFWLGNVLRATPAYTFPKAELPKVVRRWRVLKHFDLKMCFAPKQHALFWHLNFQQCSDVGVFCIHLDLEICFAPQRHALFRQRNFQKCRRMVCFVHFDLEMCFAPHRRTLFRKLNFQKWSDVGVFWTFWLENVLRAKTACTFLTSQLPKVLRRWRVLYIWTWKFVSRHNGVHFFDISTSKSGLRMVCFVHFDLEMCFAPHRRTLFRKLNFQKWSEVGVFWTFWLGNVLRATTVCTLSTSALPTVLRRWRVLYIWTWKCASRHNGVQFFISHLPSWLCTCRFSEVTFRPSGATNHWKNTVNRDFPTFSRTCIVSLLTFSLFDLLHLWSSPPWLFPCFSISAYCREFDF